MNQAVAETTPVARAADSRVARHGAIALRSADEVAGIARAGEVVAAALEAAEHAVQQGITTGEIDAIVRSVIAAHGGEAAFLGYAHASDGPAFPAAACISVGNEVVHGIPGARVLRSGEVVKIDVGVRLDGWCADAAIAVRVPGAASEAVAVDAFIADAWETLHAGIAAMQPGARWSDIADRMQRLAVARGHGMVDGWHGHGIGRGVHEAPHAPSVVSAGLRSERDFTLLPGMVVAVEPILVMGAKGTIDADGCLDAVPTSVASDSWTVTVADGLVAAHVEHTVAVTRSGPRILTRRTGNRAGQSPIEQHGGCGRARG